MKKFYIPILTVTLLAAGLVGCNKYEEGPALSFRSASARVVNDWEPKVILEDGTDITFFFQNFSINFTEDGRFVAMDKEEQDSVFSTQEGLWSLENNNEELQLIYTDPPINPDRVTYQIQKLRNDEIWLLEDRDSVVLDIRYIAKGSAEEETE